MVLYASHFTETGTEKLNLPYMIVWKQPFYGDFSLFSAVIIGSSWTIEESHVDEMTIITVLISHVWFLLFQLSKQSNLIYFIVGSYDYGQNVFDWQILNIGLSVKLNGSSLLTTTWNRRLYFPIKASPHFNFQISSNSYWKWRVSVPYLFFIVCLVVVVF